MRSHGGQRSRKASHWSRRKRTTGGADDGPTPKGAYRNGVQWCRHLADEPRWVADSCDGTLYVNDRRCDYRIPKVDQFDAVNDEAPKLDQPWADAKQRDDTESDGNRIVDPGPTIPRGLAKTGECRL